MNGSTLNGIVNNDWSPKAGSMVMAAFSDPLTPQSPSSPPRGQSLLECDYDINPTYLYQAMEARQWDHVTKVLTSEDSHTQAATWVVRKETTGKLRWRLLPIHACVIFQAPLDIVELLLQEYPVGAQCKDDQGMLPLHLAFRNETPWDVVEELMTAYPHAISVKDRKGRTPTACASTSSKKNVGVLDLYSQIAVSAERQRSTTESRAVLEARVNALQDTHVKTLGALKTDWKLQRDNLEHNLNETKSVLTMTQTALEQTSQQLEEKMATEVALTDKLRQVTLALSTVNEARRTEEAQELKRIAKRESLLTDANEELLILVQSLLEQHTSLKEQLDQQALSTKDVEDAQAKALEEYSRTQLDMELKAREQRSIWRNLLHDHGTKATATLSDVMTKITQAIPPEITATPPDIGVDCSVLSTSESGEPVKL